MAPYAYLLGAEDGVLLLQYSNILLLVFTRKTRVHVLMRAKEHLILCLREYISAIMGLLAWDTNNVISFSKETNMASMILQSHMCGKVRIDFKELIEVTVYCRVMSRQPFIIIFGAYVHLINI